MSSDALYLKRLQADPQTITVNKTRPADTTTYADGDTISESPSAGTVLTFANFARQAGGGGWIMSAQLIISTAQALKLDSELWIFDTAPATTLNDNVAWAPTDAELKTRVAVISFLSGLWKTGAGNGGIEVEGLSKYIACAAASTSLFGVLRAKNAYIPTSAEEITVRLHCDRVK